MKKTLSALLSLCLLLSALASCLIACGNHTGKNDSTAQESETYTESQSNGSDSSTEIGTDETETEPSPKLNIQNGDLIELADKLSNKVNAYFPDGGKRESFVLENMNMSLEYELRGSEDQLVKSLTNKKGKSYLENTMDVFVKMKDGKTYYSSETDNRTTPNLYRLGYYYYDARLENQGFISELNVTAEKSIALKFSNFKDLRSPKAKDGVVNTTVSGSDPYLVFANIDFSSEYDYFQITLKSDSNKLENLTVYYMSEEMENFDDSCTAIIPLNCDGEYHTYSIYLGDSDAYKGKIKGLRIDFAGDEGTQYSFKDTKIVQIDTENTPTALYLGRSFLVYSDKMHHYAQFCATDTVTNIDAVGMLTQLNADKVASYVIKDAKGLHYDTLEGIDWKSAEYAGFDIKDVGIFGYILPCGEYGGQIEISLKDGQFSIVQTLTPPNNTIAPASKNTKNANDFYLGQRIYTDSYHSFDAFLKEAELERNPLSKESFIIDDKKSSGAEVIGYDNLRGTYLISFTGAPSFNEPFYQYPNRHFNVSFTVKGDDLDRKIYLTTCATSDALEFSALLDSQEMMLPIPIEVAKNFSEANGERNLYNIDDPPYSEVILPLIVNKGESRQYTVVHAYQNWGQFPLKQLSSIQYSSPYYHLSTGVTESNCIIPYYVTRDFLPSGKKLYFTLPDHRAASAPYWDSQPQHTLGGYHFFLQYTDADGYFSASENTLNTITSYGPTYAEVKMDYLSYDGKIKVRYTHMEMPQTDENRTYYVMEYEVLEDISFKDFKNDFCFYSVRENNTGSYYSKVGYLDENNQPKVVTANATSTAKEYILGDYFPYFDFFEVNNYTNENGYCNLSFLIGDYSFTIGGKQSDARFIVVDKDRELFLSLNLSEVTLKKGDKFVINAILLPWGSQESSYDGSNGKAPDQNVLDVRQNTLIDPLKGTAVADCELIESAFLPQFRTTNGKSATFTLSGGENNVATRIFGFDKLTVPKIQEMINGEWVDYKVNSADTPDFMGYSNFYDGYGVQYDDDGSFSYSFVTTLTGDAKRTFRLIADEDFKGWPEKDDTVVKQDPLPLYFDAQELDTAATGCKGAGSKELLNEDNISFLRLYGNGNDPEGHFTPYVASSLLETGSLITVKYRIPTSNSESAGTFEFYTSTVRTSPSSEDYINVGNLKKDGKWHVLVLDAAKFNGAGFSPSENGKYYTKYFRIDFFNQPMSESSYIDIAYLGISNDLKKICDLNVNEESITFLSGKGSAVLINPKTGEELTGKATYIDPSSGYKESSVMYCANIDMINGLGEGNDAKFDQKGGNSIKGIEILDYDVSTVKNQHLIFSGWTVVEGGIEDYVWSADGGKTWHSMTLINGLPEIGKGSDAHVEASSIRLKGYTFADPSKSVDKCIYQGALGQGENVWGIAADLSAYAGKMVNVTFAAVPKKQPNTLCLIAHVMNVRVTN